MRGCSTEERFAAKYEKDGSGCWPWTAYVNQGGYGMFMLDGRARVAHRIAYELYVGPIPEGLTLDHLCHNPKVCTAGDRCPHRRCVNPAHLEPVTMHENMLRGGSPAAFHATQTHCNRGHAFDAENTIVRSKGGGRDCRRCRNVLRRWRRRRDRIEALTAMGEMAAARTAA